MGEIGVIGVTNSNADRDGYEKERQMKITAKYDTTDEGN
jgi:hypothetical protein